MASTRADRQAASKRKVPTTWRHRRSQLHLPHLLIEADEGEVSPSDPVAFWKAGFNPTFCEVPAAEGSCPVLSGERCPLVDAADVVLHRLDRETGIVGAINRDRPELAVVVSAPHHRRDVISPEVDALQQAVSAGSTWKRAVGRLGIAQG